MMQPIRFCWIALLALMGFAVTTGAQTIAITSPVNNAVFCAGANVSISFTITGTFNAGNIFTAQLSDAAGSFAAPTTIGTLAGTTGGTIPAIIPGASPAGVAYKIQLISSNPASITSPAITDLTINLAVAAPVFTAGPSNVRCQGAGIVTYAATATNSTGITYSLDAASTGAGNSINPTTGAVTYVAAWAGPSVITATAAGCGGPLSSFFNVTTSAAAGVPVFTPGPAVTRCQGSSIINYAATATNSSSIAYSLDAASITGGNSINATTGDVTYAAAYSGTTTITATATGCSGTTSSTFVVTTAAGAGIPVFTAGPATSRCQGAGTVTYTATSTNSTGITYSLDGASTAAGNSIVATTGAVTYVATWAGTSTITATANGCAGAVTNTFVVTSTSTIGTPVFTAGPATTRCQGIATITYTATSTGSTSITYTLDAASTAGGNSIAAATGAVTYAATWTGTSTITATAAGCNGPKTNTFTVTTTPSVALPVFVAASTRCQGAGSVSYAATAGNSTSIAYTLDAVSLLAGNTINATTGLVTYVAGYNGPSSITATALGCNGPSVTVFNVTTTPTVGATIFTAGPLATRCQGAGTVTYAATASSSTSITYTLDAASIAGGNSIVAATGAVTYVAVWAGTSTITATSAGCNGPTTANFVVTTTPTVSTPVFTAGPPTVRCQGAGTVSYPATAANSTGITYTLDAASIAGGNTIVAATGAVTYSAGWSGTTTITASAAGCNGPATANLIITITPTVGTPAFTAPTARCQGSGPTAYTATATNNTGITYTLDALALAGGNTIVAATGVVTYSATWVGSATITATATGCNGPKVTSTTVVTTATVGTPVFALGATSTRCANATTNTYSATATTTTGITYSLDAGSAAVGVTINSGTGAVTFVPSYTGPTTITASAAGCNGPALASHTVTVGGAVANPVFTAGPSPVRCQGASVITYAATALNSLGINYSLDAVSLAAGNSINTGTGAVTYTAGYSGVSIITATSTGCNTTSANFTVTITPSVVTPVFSLGAASQRCRGAGTVTYTASSANSTGLTYSLDAASLAGGNTIVASTGAVTYAATWSGTTVITATSTGCNGPLSATHTVTVTPFASVPVFTTGLISVRCQQAGAVTYTATALNGTVTYGIDIASQNAGNSINPVNGTIVFAASYSGVTTITATATGCAGPQTTSTFIVTVNPIPVLSVTQAPTQTQCNGATTLPIILGSSVSGTTYSGLVNSNPSIGTPTLGSGIISAFTAVNNSNTLDSTTFTVTGSANGCPASFPATAKVIVRPTPQVNVISSGYSFCSGDSANTAINFTSSITGVPVAYNWANSNTAIGLAASGSGNIVPFKATNPGNAPITATITVTPIIATCTGVPTTVTTITVKPLPQLVATDSTSVCSGSPLNLLAGSSISASVSPTTYLWSRNAVPGVLNTTLTNQTSNPVTETLMTPPTPPFAPQYVTYVFKLTSAGCSLDNQMRTVIVNPVPQSPLIAKFPAGGAICQGIIGVNFAANRAAFTNEVYVWSSVNGTVQQLADSSNRQFSLVNFPNPATTTVTLKSHVGNIGCSNAGDTKSFSITSSGSSANPNVVFFDNNLVCQANGVTRYQWGFDKRANLDSAVIPGATTQNYHTDATFDPNNNYYWVIADFADGCRRKAYYNSPVLAVQHIITATGISIKVYPNPVQSVLNVELPDYAGHEYTIEVYDLAGKMLQRAENVGTKTQLAVDGFAPGYYVIGCFHNGIRVGTSRFIKN